MNTDKTITKIFSRVMLTGFIMGFCLLAGVQHLFGEALVNRAVVRITGADNLEAERALVKIALLENIRKAEFQEIEDRYATGWGEGETWFIVTSEPGFELSDVSWSLYRRHGSNVYLYQDYDRDMFNIGRDIGAKATD